MASGTRAKLSVIQECMPTGASELRHLHTHARQFFFVLAGEALLEVNGAEHRLLPQQGLEIAPGMSHRIFNRGETDLHFLVVSQPPSHGDRVPSVD
jgi:mannose-6-phosphate isomerase-like protein (cupin superfamily)